jgi:hypothetical protein
MQANQLELRAVEALRSESFFVPSYQRGYRWTRQQVTELLNDVWEFARSGAKSRNEFYCLQPVVVAARAAGGWEVVDGQQRLTTLHLLLSHFNERKAEKYREKIFDIAYDTRPASAAFLRQIRPENSQDNIDFFHMAEAAAAIETWFKDKSSFVADCETAFRNDVKVIWYEVGDEVKPTDVFRRLNVGKIPLVDAELVKALFLRASNFTGGESRLQQMRQLQIATEWDAIERRLQDDNFWYFLTNSPRSTNRIDFVLRLSIEHDQPNVQVGARHGGSIFHTFYEKLSGPDADAWGKWASVKQMFMTLEEWYEDPVLHHLVGFLASQTKISAHSAIERVTRLSAESSSKSEFRRRLRADIFAQLFRGKDKPEQGEPMRDFIRAALTELDYVSDGKTIRNVLLLFNLTSLLASRSTVRFPFGSYKTEQWDIEHIRSVASRMPERVDDQKSWLANVVAHFGGANRGDTLVDRANVLVVAEKFDPTEFRELFEELRESHDPGQEGEVDNSLGNLTLLDAETNRSYGNAMFPLKRRRIIERDKTGRFVPLCTKNAFLKYYSPHVDRMLMWTKADIEAHVAAIVERLSSFFNEGRSE